MSVARMKGLGASGVMKIATYDPAGGAKQVAFADELITDHNSLSGIQGGIAGEYYHTTLAQNNSFQQQTLLSQFNSAYTTNYVEYTKTLGVITQIDVWDTIAKGTKLFTKTYTYNSDSNPTIIVITDEITSNVLTITNTYTLTDITATSKVFT